MSSLPDEEEGSSDDVANDESQPLSDGHTDQVNNGSHLSALFRSRSARITSYLLVLSKFYSGLSFSIYAPFFPQLAEEKGVEPTIYSVVIGLYHLSALVTIFCVDIWIKEFRQKTVLSSGCFAIGGSVILTGVLWHCPNGIQFIILAALIRIMEGFGAASVNLAAYYIVASRFQNLWMISILLEGCFFLGLSIGPIAGGSIYNVGTFSIPFYGYGGLALLASLVVLVLHQRHESPIRWEKLQFLKIFNCRANFLYLTVYFITSYYDGFLQGTMRSFVEQFQMNNLLVGVIFAVPAIAQCISGLCWMWIITKDICNTVLLATSCTILLFVSAILLGPAPFINEKPSKCFLIAALVLKGIGQSGTTISCFYSAFQDTMTSGFANGVATHRLLFKLYLVGTFCGMFIGSSSSGVLYDYFHFRNSTLILLCLEGLVIIASTIYAFKRNYRRRIPYRLLDGNGDT